MYFFYSFTAILVVFTLWFLKWYIKWRRELYQYMEQHPGPKRYPVIGTMYLVLGIKRPDMFKTIVNIVEKNQPYFRMWTGPLAELHIAKPEYLEQIMSSTSHIEKGFGYSFFKPWLGDGLLISSAGKWHQRRKMITPTFHFKILEQFLDVFVDKSKLLVDVLHEKTTGESFDIQPLITLCALDIICETAMGVKINAMSGTDHSYTKAVSETAQQIMARTTNPVFLTDLYYYFPAGKAFQKNLDILHQFTSKVICDRRKILEETKTNTTKPVNKKRSFLDLLLEYDNPLTEDEIREEVDTFMFGGHDTTTTSICWCIFLLANNPDIQDKAYEEVKSVLGDRKTPETVYDLNELKYLERCVKEALRMYPSVPFIGRTIGEDLYIDGKKVPKGVQCALHIYSIHRNPEYYPEPDMYDPDRFLPEKCIERHPYAYVPFSAGPRNCIGQKFAMYEEKTILASILKSYKIIAVDTPDTINLISEIILKSENGIKIKLEKRED